MSSVFRSSVDDIPCLLSLSARPIRTMTTFICTYIFIVMCLICSKAIKTGNQINKLVIDYFSPHPLPDISPLVDTDSPGQFTPPGYPL